MKKLLALMMALVMVLALAACGGDAGEEDVPVITQGNDDDQAQAQDQDQPADVQQDAQAAANGPYSYTYEGVKLMPGDPFEPGKLPEATSVYEVPSCAIEGTDNLYNYGTFELTAFNDGTGQVIYSIFFIDPNITTDEGLALGDDMAKMIELYGEGYTQEGTAYTYTGENTILSVIIQNDTVNSIEFRMVV